MNKKRVPYHTRLKSNFDRLLYIIFFFHNTDTYSPCCLCEREGFESKALKKKSFEKKFEKNFLKKNLEKKLWKKVLTKKMLEK